MQPTSVDLQARIEALEAENAVLRQRTESPQADVGGDARERRGRKRSWAWTLLSAVLILIGALLAPLAVVGSWARVQLTDTDRFVAAFAPLADDPGLQTYVANETVDVINQNIDVDQITADVIDGVITLGTGPRATEALNALKGPAAQGIQSLIESKVLAFVQSDAFADVWTSALTISHRQLVATLSNDPDAAVSLGPDGSIGVQIGPIVEAIKTELIEQRIGLASAIPEIDRTIVVATSDAIPTVQLAYNLAIAAGTWLPWVALLFLALGVLVARRRSIALIWSAVALAIVMTGLALTFAIGESLFITSVSPSVIPSDVAGLLFGTVVGAMQATTVAVLVLAITVAVMGWLGGPYDVPRRLRGLTTSTAGTIRNSAEQHGVTTGRAGVWIYRHRAFLRVAVAVLASAAVIFIRPVTPGLIIWTLVLALIALAIIELAQRPTPEARTAGISTPETSTPEISTSETPEISAPKSTEVDR